METNQKNETTQPTIESEAQTAVAARGQGNLTMYSLVQALNVVRQAHGLSPVREQMLYNYRGKGLIKDLVDGKATPKGAVAFIVKNVTKATTPAA